MKSILRDLLPQKSPLVMGILNATPDSFSDGGRFVQRGNALTQAQAMIEQGADIIDIGGESTRPGAAEVSVQQELDRVIPLIEAIVDTQIAISIDTSKAEVMREAIKAGAVMVNDVRALQEEGALEVVAETDVDVCLMHMQGQPRTMQQAPHYRNVTQEVLDFLLQRIKVCNKAGISSDRICLDPGFGFGKTLQNNCQLMNDLQEFRKFKLPLLIGVSRKSMIGQILACEVDERLIGSLAAAQYAVQKGAKILRVHDVKETVQMVKVFNAFENGFSHNNP
ncbi:MAG: dihydropteroate synthase [Kangiellaceae bacterium]|nr:dihydropteroate synthase [Kangiellaceae bacterium]